MINVNKLGFLPSEFKVFKDVKELQKYSPKFVNAKVMRNVTFTLDGSKLPLKKGTTLVMPIDFYLKGVRSQDRIVQLKPCKKTFKDSFKRYSGQNLDNKTLLILRTGGIGDHLFTQPICKHIKKQFPTCKIVYACAPQFSEGFNTWPTGLVDKVITIPFNIKYLHQADYHLSFQGSVENTIQAHTTDAFNIYAEMSNLDITDFDTKLYPNQSYIDKIESKLPDNFIVVQLRASSPIRMMRIDKWTSIISKLCETTSYNFLFVDRKDKSILYDLFINEQQLTKYKSRLYNACNLSDSLSDSISIISLSQGVIGIDSSFTHIGSALNKPVFGIYGPFTGKIRMNHYDKADWIDATNSKCPNYPCNYHDDKSNQCPSMIERVPAECINSIDIDETVVRIKKILNI